MMCCKKCKYNCCKICELLNAEIKKIKYCPMMVKDELLNNAEKYMKENEPETYMRYMLSELKITLREGDVLTVINPATFWHFNDQHPSYLKVSKELENGKVECIDPYFDYKIMYYFEHFNNMGGHTQLTPDDFADMENDTWIVSTKKEDGWGYSIAPIGYNPNIFKFIENRKRKIQIK